MGQVHNALRGGSLSAALTRAVGEMRGASGLERYGETLQPTLDLWSQPEWAYLRGELLGAAFRAVAAAGAGTFAAVALCNPLTSRSIVVVEKIRVTGSSNGAFDLYMGTDSTALLGTSQLAFRRDNRPAAPDGTALTNLTTKSLLRYATIAAVAPDWNVAIERVSLANTEFISTPIVLAPGRMVIVFDTDDDAGMTVSFAFRERSNIDSER